MPPGAGAPRAPLATPLNNRNARRTGNVYIPEQQKNPGLKHTANYN